LASADSTVFGGFSPIPYRILYPLDTWFSANGSEVLLGAIIRQVVHVSPPVRPYSLSRRHSCALRTGHASTRPASVLQTVAEAVKQVFGCMDSPRENDATYLGEANAKGRQLLGDAGVITPPAKKCQADSKIRGAFVESQPARSHSKAPCRAEPTRRQLANPPRPPSGSPNSGSRSHLSPKRAQRDVRGPHEKRCEQLSSRDA
jgi:hypothetical protein